MFTTWTIAHVLRLAAAVCFFVALAVALGWFAHNWEAWTAGGLVLGTLSGLPWATRP